MMSNPIIPLTKSGWYVVEYTTNFGYGIATIIDVCYFSERHHDFDGPAFQSLSGLHFHFGEHILRYRPIDPVKYLEEKE